MKLTAYLASHDISTADFATLIGVSAEAVRLYALGKRTPRREQMKTIIEATSGEVTANDFLEASEPVARAG